MKPSKLKKLIRKLKALAEQGVGGEAESAKLRLAELLKEYNVEVDDVQEQIRVWELTTLNEGSVILEKVIRSICPDATINVKKYKSRLTIEVAMSDLDYQEARYKYRYIWNAYNSERQIFLTAFLNKNCHLFVPEMKNKPSFVPDKSKDEDKAPPVIIGQGEVPMPTDEQRRVGIMMSALRSLKYVKTTRMLGNAEDEV